MNKCSICRKVKTNDEVLALNEGWTYTYCKDVSDIKCDECEAYSRAKSCAEVINSLLANITKLASERNINDMDLYLQKSLENLKQYWINYSTCKVDTVKYSYWYEKFVQAVNHYTQRLATPKQTLQKELNY
jgi:hypothetical protein